METEQLTDLIIEKTKKCMNFEPIDEPRIINATPEEYYRQEMINESKREINASSQNNEVQERFQALVIVQTPNLCENFKETKISQESSIIPISEQNSMQTIFKHLEKVRELSQRVQAMNAELRSEREQLSKENMDLNKMLEDQERKMMEFFAMIRQDVAKLVPG